MHPVLFEVSGLTIYSYGVCTLLSYLAFGGLLLFTAKRLEVPRDAAVLFAVGLVLGGLVGGRLGFVLVNFREPGILRALFLTSGAFLFFTAVIGGVLGPMLAAWSTKRPVGTALDLITPPMLGAWAVGNLGCFLAGCCWGPLTDVPWAVRFFADVLPPEVRGQPVHPTQLYSLASDALVLALVLALPRGAPGTMFLRAVVGLVAIKLVLIALGVGHGGVMLIVLPVLAAICTALLIALRGRAAQPS
mgnify:CR=1 FL=1